MGKITDFLRLVNGTNIKKIFIYSTGRCTINGVISDLTEVKRLIINGWEVV